jgi:AcrR family transcriptional regulator
MCAKAVTVTRRPSSREAILDAAENLAGEVGANHLTLEAVAARASISKGGLLYNFPTKNALLRGMVERFVTRVREGSFEGASASAIVQKLIANRLATRKPDKEGKGVSMIAAVAEQPDLLEPIRDNHRDLWSKLKANPDRDQALIAWLAVEGLLFMELLGTSPLSSQERARLVGEVEQLLSE